MVASSLSRRRPSGIGATAAESSAKVTAGRYSVSSAWASSHAMTRASGAGRCGFDTTAGCRAARPPRSDSAGRRAPRVARCTSSRRIRMVTERMLYRLFVISRIASNEVAIEPETLGDGARIVERAQRKLVAQVVAGCGRSRCHGCHRANGRVTIGSQPEVRRRRKMRRTDASTTGRLRFGRSQPPKRALPDRWGERRSRSTQILAGS